MKLDDALTKLNMKAAELGRLVGITRNHASEVVRGVARPSPDLAARISAATGGLVTVEELLYPDGVPDGAVLARADEDEGEAGEGEGALGGSDGACADANMSEREHAPARRRRAA